MRFRQLKFNPLRAFVSVAALLILAILFIEKLNGRFWLNDFKVMYTAAEAFLNGEQVYGTPFGLSTGYYKYSPFTLLLFLPATLLSFETASVIHFLFSGFCAIVTVIVLERLIRQHLFPVRKNQFLIMIFVLLCGIVHLVRELHLGNINMILVMLLTLALYFSLDNKPVRSGLLLSLAVLAKPYFLICLLPFLANKRPKTAFSAITGIIIFALIPVFINGLSKSAVLYENWFHAMMEHNEYLNSNHTVFSLIDTYLGLTIPPRYSLYLLAAAAFFSSSFFFYLSHKPGKLNKPFVMSTDAVLMIHFFLLIAIVPSVLITDTEHFLFSLPLIAILLFHLPKKTVWPLPLFFILMFMYGGNSSDLLGKELSVKYDQLGILGISNLIIIGAVTYWFGKKLVSAQHHETSANNDKQH